MKQTFTSLLLGGLLAAMFLSLGCAEEPRPTKPLPVTSREPGPAAR